MNPFTIKNNYIRYICTITDAGNKMNRLTILIVLLSALILSCKSSNDVLPKQKMENVLWDVARGSEFLNSYVYFKHPEQNKAALNDALLERTLKIHKVTKQQFLNTLEHYRKRPDEFKIVVDSIVSKQKRLIDSDTLSSAAPGSADSLPSPVTQPH